MQRGSTVIKKLKNEYPEITRPWRDPSETWKFVNKCLGWDIDVGMALEKD